MELFVIWSTSVANSVFCWVWHVPTCLEIYGNNLTEFTEGCASQPGHLNMYMFPNQNDVTTQVWDLLITFVKTHSLGCIITKPLHIMWVSPTLELKSGTQAFSSKASGICLARKPFTGFNKTLLWTSSLELYRNPGNAVSIPTTDQRNTHHKNWGSQPLVGNLYL